MRNALEGIESAFWWVLDSSILCTVIIAMILLLRAVVGKRLPARWQAALWLVLLVRMLMPIAPESRMSVFNWVRTGVGDTVIMLPEIGPMPMAQGPVEMPAIAPVPALPLEATMPAATMEIPPPPIALGWKGWMALAWAAVTLLLALYILRVNFRFARQVPGRVAESTQGGGEAADLDALLAECRAQMGIKRRVTVQECDLATGPALYGFLRPRILLPEGAAETLSTASLRHIFLHELAHVKRNDILVNWIMTALQALHWFNPAVWYAFHRYRADREYACDELALRYTAPGESRDYGGTLLGLAEHWGGARYVVSLAGIAEGNGNLKERIRRIARFRYGARTWSVLALAVVGVLAAVSLTDAADGKGPGSEFGQLVEMLVDEDERGKSAAALSDRLTEAQGALPKEDIDKILDILKPRLGNMAERIRAGKNTYSIYWEEIELVSLLISKELLSDQDTIDILRRLDPVQCTYFPRHTRMVTLRGKFIGSMPKGSVAICYRRLGAIANSGKTVVLIERFLSSAGNVSWSADELVHFEVTEPLQLELETTWYITDETLAAKLPTMGNNPEEIAAFTKVIENQATRKLASYAERGTLEEEHSWKTDFGVLTDAAGVAVGGEEEVEAENSAATSSKVTIDGVEAESAMDDGVVVAESLWHGEILDRTPPELSMDNILVQYRASTIPWERVAIEAEQRSPVHPPDLKSMYTIYKESTRFDVLRHREIQDPNGNWVDSERGSLRRVDLPSGTLDTMYPTKDGYLLNGWAYVPRESEEKHRGAVSALEFFGPVLGFESESGRHIADLLADGSRLELRSAMESVDGEACCVIDGTNPSFGRFVLWLDPEASFLPRRIVRYRGGGQQYYGHVLGEPYPAGSWVGVDDPIMNSVIEQYSEMKIERVDGVPVVKSARLDVIRKYKDSPKRSDFHTDLLVHSIIPDSNFSDTDAFAPKIESQILSGVAPHIALYRFEEGKIRRRRTMRVSGLILDASGTPAADAQVELHGNRIPGGFASAKTSADGQFAFPTITAGEYEVGIYPDSASVSVEFITVEEGENLTDLQFLVGGVGERVRPFNAREVAARDSTYGGRSEEKRVGLDPAIQRAECAENLRQLGTAMQHFVGDASGAPWPALDPRPGYLQPLVTDLYPGGLAELGKGLGVLICPAALGTEGLPDLKDPANAQWHFDHSSYWYLGHAVGEESQVAGFVEGYKRAMLENTPLRDDFLVDENGQDWYKNSRRLREGVERFFITDINDPQGWAKAQSRLPLLIERPGHHEGGGHVLYMDGHVEFVEYPGKFPMTETFVAAMQELDALRDQPYAVRLRFDPHAEPESGMEKSEGAVFGALRRGPGPDSEELWCMFHAGIGHKFPVRKEGGPILFEVVLLEGDDDRLLLEVRTEEGSEEVEVLRDASVSATVAGVEYKLRYPSTNISSDTATNYVTNKATIFISTPVSDPAVDGEIAGVAAVLERVARAEAWRQRSAFDVATVSTLSVRAGGATHENVDYRALQYRRDGARAEVFGRQGFRVEAEAATYGNGRPPLDMRFARIVDGERDISATASADSEPYTGILKAPSDLTTQAAIALESPEHGFVFDTRHLVGQAWGTLFPPEKATLRPGVETVAGYDCYVVEADTELGKATAWIAKDAGYNLAKFILVKGPDDFTGEAPGEDSDGGDRETRKVSDYGLKSWTEELDGVRFAEIGGVFVPVAGVYTRSTSQTYGADVSLRVEVTRENIGLAPDFEALDAFALDRLEGAVLRDGGNGKHVVKGGEVVLSVEASGGGNEGEPGASEAYSWFDIGEIPEEVARDDSVSQTEKGLQRLARCDLKNIHIEKVLDSLMDVADLNIQLDYRAVARRSELVDALGGKEDFSDVGDLTLAPPKTSNSYGRRWSGVIPSFSFHETDRLSSMLDRLLALYGLDYSVQEGFLFISKPEILARESFENVETRRYVLAALPEALRAGTPEEIAARIDAAVPATYLPSSDEKASKVRVQSAADAVIITNTPTRLDAFERANGIAAGERQRSILFEAVDTSGEAIPGARVVLVGVGGWNAAGEYSTGKSIQTSESYYETTTNVVGVAKLFYPEFVRDGILTDTVRVGVEYSGHLTIREINVAYTYYPLSIRAKRHDEVLSAEEALGRKVTMSFENIHVKELLDLFAEDLGIDFEIDWRAVARPDEALEEVWGELVVDADGVQNSSWRVPFLSVQEVTAGEALKIVLRPIGLDYAIRGNTVVVSAPRFLREQGEELPEVGLQLQEVSD